MNRYRKRTKPLPWLHGVKISFDVKRQHWLFQLGSQLACIELMFYEEFFPDFIHAKDDQQLCRMFPRLPPFVIVCMYEERTG